MYFNEIDIYFAAVLIMAAQRIEANGVAREGLINIKARMDVNPLHKNAIKARNARTKTTVRSLWRMLYADDAGIASLSQEGLSAIMTIIVRTCTEFGLSVSEPKTKTLCFRPRDGAAADEPVNLEMNIEAADQAYEQVDKFLYLGSLQTHDHDIKPELDRRRGSSWAKMKRYSKPIFDAKKGISVRIKTRMYNVEVRTALL